jgi:periplasmic copper chaperone A
VDGTGIVGTGASGLCGDRSGTNLTNRVNFHVSRNDWVDMRVLRFAVVGPLVALSSSGAVGILGIVGVVAPQAGAHAKPNKSAAPAGTRQEIRFTIEHGCGNSPTTQVSVRLPVGVSKPAPKAPKGWTVEVAKDQRVVTWSGGSLPSKTKGDFAVTMSFPSTKGTTLSFPMVQTCTKGTLRWIEGPGSQYPAPTVKLT